jgi:hypothetical protein
MILVRLNMAPVFALLVPFVFWNYGRRAGWWALAAGGIVLAAGHAFFWPEILKIWSYWLPDGLTPFLDPWRQPEAARFWDPQVVFANRFFSFLEGMRLHFLSVMGLFTALLYRPSAGSPVEERRTVAFTAGLYAVLLVEHAAASLALNYCVYCFSVYIAFFAPLGLVLLVLTLPGSFRALSIRQRMTAVAFVIVFAFLIGLGAHDQVGDALARLRLPRVWSWLRGDPAPGLPIWDVLETRFGLEYAFSRRTLSAAAGLLGGLALAALSYALRRRLRDKGVGIPHLFLAAGLLLTPTSVLGNGFRTYDCGRDVLARVEAVGAELAGLIPSGTRVYWRGGDSAVPLVYVPEARLYPPQINGDYTLFDLDDTDALLQFGLWSDALSEQWLGEADVVLIETARYEGALRTAVGSAGLRLVTQTSEPYPCRPGSEILVFSQP